MRKGNVTILASIFAIALVSMVFGAGTMTWFSDVETAEVGQVYAATLDMEIKEYGGDWQDGTPVDISVPDSLKPGDTFTVDIRLKNIGTTDIQYVFASFRDLTWEGGYEPESEWDEANNGLHLIKQIIVAEVWEYSPLMGGSGGECTTTFNAETANAWLAFWNVASPWTAPLDGSISLHDLVYCAEPGGGSELTSFRFHTGDGGDPPYHTRFAYLPVGGIVKIKFTFKLLENTDNRAQGDRCQFSIYFIGSNLLVPDPSL